MDGGTQAPVSLAAIRLPNSMAACLSIWICLSHLKQSRTVFYASCIPLFVCLHVAPYGFLSLALVGLLKSFEDQSRFFCVAASFGLLLYGDMAWTLTFLVVSVGLLFTSKQKMAWCALSSFIAYFVLLFLVSLTNEFVHSHLFLYYWSGFGHMWYASPRPVVSWYAFALILMIPGLLRFNRLTPALAFAGCYFYFVRDANQLVLEKALPFSVLACWHMSATVTAPRWVRSLISCLILVLSLAVFSEFFQRPLFGTSAGFAKQWLFSSFQILFYLAAVFSFIYYVVGVLCTVALPIFFTACWLIPFLLFQASEKKEILQFLESYKIKNYTVMGDFNPWWLLQNSSIQQAPLISSPHEWPLTGHWFVTQNLRGGMQQCEVLAAEVRFANELYVVCKISEN